MLRRFLISRKGLAFLGMLMFGRVQSANGETVFIEAESMRCQSDGWKAPENVQTRRASRVKLMQGADGAGDRVALPCDQRMLIGLSNQSLQPLDRVHLQLRTWHPVTRVKSVRHGVLVTAVDDVGVNGFNLPLGPRAFVKVTHAPPELRIGKMRVGKVLFLGNSITLHGPAPQIGWTGNWGMAASTRDKDYVHRLVADIARAAGGEPQVIVRNIADFERGLGAFNIPDTLKEELAFQPEVIILAIGENAASPKTDLARTEFATAFANLLAELKQHGQPTIFVRSQFWEDTEKDQLMKKASTDAGVIFIDISKLGSDPANFARAERQIDHAGVAGHPGDKGMQALADALWTALKKESGTID